MPERFAIAGLALLAAAPVQAATLMVDVANVRNARGLVHVDLCPEPLFLKEDCPISAEAPAHIGVTTLVLRNVPPGAYAIQASHDENANHKVDRALFGIPKEGVGFSRGARIALGPPKWRDAVFAVDGRDQRLGFRLRYFLGPAGPDPR